MFCGLTKRAGSEPHLAQYMGQKPGAQVGNYKTAD